jgi:hypothetical protein
MGVSVGRDEIAHNLAVIVDGPGLAIRLEDSGSQGLYWGLAYGIKEGTRRPTSICGIPDNLPEIVDRKGDAA